MPEWVIPVIVAALVVLIVAGVVVLIRKHRFRPRTAVQIHVEESRSQPDIPLERQPVAPIDQAEGFGWMKASDLANQKNKP